MKYDACHIRVYFATLNTTGGAWLFFGRLKHDHENCSRDDSGQKNYSSGNPLHRIPFSQCFSWPGTTIFQISPRLTSQVAFQRLPWRQDRGVDRGPARGKGNKTVVRWNRLIREWTSSHTKRFFSGGTNLRLVSIRFGKQNLICDTERETCETAMKRSMGIWCIKMTSQQKVKL